MRLLNNHLDKNNTKRTIKLRINGMLHDDNKTTANLMSQYFNEVIKIFRYTLHYLTDQFLDRRTEFRFEIYYFSRRQARIM